MTGGIILLDKPAGISSARAIALVKKKLGLRKIGHAGTLDPMATGLLICLVDGATKLADQAGAGQKEYSGTIKLGLKTDSDDITGKVIQESDKIPSFVAVREIASALVGRLMQVPPAISALKVSGVPAYKLARKGTPAELSAREVFVYAFEVEPVAEGLIGYRIRCGKGTYVRALARDLGDILGCGACVASLRRECSEPFSVSQAATLDEVSAKNILSPNVLFESQGTGPRVANLD